jgi:hypothetical protein
MQMGAYLETISALQMLRFARFIRALSSAFSSSLEPSSYLPFYLESRELLVDCRLANYNIIDFSSSLAPSSHLLFSLGEKKMK